MDYVDENNFKYTNEYEAQEICKILKCEYIGQSRIDGYAIMRITNESLFNNYNKYLQFDDVPLLEDHIYYFKSQRTQQKFRIVKIRKHNLHIFKKREEKLKRILKYASE